MAICRTTGMLIATWKAIHASASQRAQLWRRSMNTAATRVSSSVPSTRHPRNETLAVVESGKQRASGGQEKSVDPVQIASLRAAGQSWRTIARSLGVSVGTVFALAANTRKSILL